jgi:hypothetical protein
VLQPGEPGTRPRGLRDGFTSAAWSARFGILRDDYTPKPAFTTLQHLIATA